MRDYTIDDVDEMDKRTLVQKLVDDFDEAENHLLDFSKRDLKKMLIGLLQEEEDGGFDPYPNDIADDDSGNEEHGPT